MIFLERVGKIIRRKKKGKTAEESRTLFAIKESEV